MTVVSGNNLDKCLQHLLDPFHQALEVKTGEIVSILRRMKSRRAFNRLTYELHEPLCDLGSWGGLNLNGPGYELEQLGWLIEADGVLATPDGARHPLRDKWHHAMMVVKARIAVNELQRVICRAPEDLLICVAHLAAARDSMNEVKLQGVAVAGPKAVATRLEALRLHFVNAFYASTGIAGLILGVRRIPE